MGNALHGFIELSSAEKAKRGLVHTPSEIQSQVELWPDTVSRVKGSLPRLTPLMRKLRESPKPACMLTGAGTSQFAGYCVEGLFRKNLGLPVNVVSTAEVVTTPEDVFVEGRDTLLVNFARSGNSPESLGAVRIADQSPCRVMHLAITCNREGALSKALRDMPECVVLMLDERTNDGGLAMTASFSNMVVAAQGIAWIDRFQEYEGFAERLVSCGGSVLRTAPDIVREVSGLEFDRAVFLGSGANYGTAVESHLKLQELTAGQVMCAYETFPGLRHGPEAVVNDDTLIVAFLSRDPYVRLYETDLLRELKDKRLGRAVLLCCDRIDGSLTGLFDYAVEYDPAGESQLPDSLTPPVQVITGQLLGLFASIQRGLKPDDPSETGVIHRVVKGVKVYDRERYEKTGEVRIIAER